MDLKKLKTSTIFKKEQYIYVGVIIENLDLKFSVSDLKEFYKGKKINVDGNVLKMDILDVDGYINNQDLNKINVFFKTDLTAEKDLKVNDLLNVI
ncbi:hypothetical protein SY27_11675 [Flavobacterium sp. 316]|uniref:hypothetical protein n=1 Tax=Flavobacterium sp. 316 TaxID=1603293 RepID=UPI0005DE2EE5|nr:hypothetical protein [Flavobacterium sp. 316]KIX20564.1 hypothetical protein SY27_11675 [Flavobacterium sp. 316]